MRCLGYTRQYSRVDNSHPVNALVHYEAAQSIMVYATRGGEPTRYFGGRRTMRFLIRSFLLLWLTRNHIVQAQDPCSICREGEVVTLPDVVIPEGFAYVLDKDTTCADLEAEAQNGDFSETECAFLGSYGVSDDCGCIVPPTPTVAPAQPETPAPVVSETPVALPTPIPAPVTDAPSPPVDEFITTSEEFYVSLAYVVGSHTVQSDEGLIEACEKLFDEYYPEEGLEDLFCDVIMTQRSYAQGRQLRRTPPTTPNQQHHRALQQNNTQITLGVVMNVTVVLTSDIQALNETEMLAIWNDNMDEFITYLKTGGSEESQLYFGNVTMGEVASDSFPDPTDNEEADDTTDDSNDGLSDGAQAGIIVAAVVAVVAIAYLMFKGKNVPAVMVAKRTVPPGSAWPGSGLEQPGIPDQGEASAELLHNNDQARSVALGSSVGVSGIAISLSPNNSNDFSSRRAEPAGEASAHAVPDMTMNNYLPETKDQCREIPAERQSNDPPLAPAIIIKPEAVKRPLDKNFEETKDQCRETAAERQSNDPPIAPAIIIKPEAVKGPLAKIFEE